MTADVGERRVSGGVVGDGFRREGWGFGVIIGGVVGVGVV